jgi:hypothetical protein
MRTEEEIKNRIKKLKEQANKEEVLTLTQLHELLIESNALSWVLEQI